MRKQEDGNEISAWANVFTEQRAGDRDAKAFLATGDFLPPFFAFYIL